MRQACTNKQLNRLYAAPQSRGIYFAKRNMAVGLIKGTGLCKANIVQAAVHATSLHYAFQIVVGLAMPDKIDFFERAFCAILSRL